MLRPFHCNIKPGAESWGTGQNHCADGRLSEPFTSEVMASDLCD